MLKVARDHDGRILRRNIVIAIRETICQFEHAPLRNENICCLEVCTQLPGDANSAIGARFFSWICKQHSPVTGAKFSTMGGSHLWGRTPYDSNWVAGGTSWNGMLQAVVGKNRHDIYYQKRGLMIRPTKSQHEQIISIELRQIGSFQWMLNG